MYCYACQQSTSFGSLMQVLTGQWLWLFFTGTGPLHTLYMQIRSGGGSHTFQD